MWTSTEHSQDSLFTRSLTIPVFYTEDPVLGDLQMVTSDRVGVIREVLIKTDGHSIRCVKDQTTGARAWDLEPRDERSASTQKLVGERLAEDMILGVGATIILAQTTLPYAMVDVGSPT